MATIRKRGNSYQIRVSCGYDTQGRQVEQAMTWTPDEKLTARQIEKELNRQAVLFEEKCLKGNVTAPEKFQDYCERWLYDTKIHQTKNAENTWFLLHYKNWLYHYEQPVFLIY